MSNRTLKLKTQKAFPFAENPNKTKQRPKKKPKQNKTKRHVLATYTSHGKLSALFSHSNQPQDKVMALFLKSFHDNKVIFTHILKEDQILFQMVLTHRKRSF